MKQDLGVSSLKTWRARLRTYDNMARRWRRCPSDLMGTGSFGPTYGVVGSLSTSTPLSVSLSILD